MGVPETVTIDKSGANLAALEAINVDRETPIKILQSRYLALLKTEWVTAFSGHAS
jgi:hypothetical protein